MSKLMNKIEKEYFENFLIQRIEEYIYYYAISDYKTRAEIKYIIYANWQLSLNSKDKIWEVIAKNGSLLSNKLQNNKTIGLNHNNIVKF